MIVTVEQIAPGKGTVGTQAESSPEGAVEDSPGRKSGVGAEDD